VQGGAALRPSVAGNQPAAQVAREEQQQHCFEQLWAGWKHRHHSISRTVVFTARPWVLTIRATVLFKGLGDIRADAAAGNMIRAQRTELSWLRDAQDFSVAVQSGQLSGVCLPA
jgi:hypothetical protein